MASGTEPVITFEDATWVSKEASTVSVPLANMTDAGRNAQELVGKGVNSGGDDEIYEITSVAITDNLIECTMAYKGSVNATNIAMVQAEGTLVDVKTGKQFAITTNYLRFTEGL